MAVTLQNPSVAGRPTEVNNTRLRMKCVYTLRRTRHKGFSQHGWRCEWPLNTKNQHKKDTATKHEHTMPKRHADSTQDENPPKRRQLSADEVFVEAAKNGDTTAVRAVLEKLPPESSPVVFDAVHETCRGNHNECLALLLPYVDTTQVGFGILLSECVHANHVACTEVLLQHWKSVCSNVTFVPQVSEHRAGEAMISCPAMWSDPAVCRVLIDAGADVHTKNENGLSPLHYTCSSVGGDADVVQVLIDAGADIEMKDCYGYSPLHSACTSGALEVVKMLVRVGAAVCVTDNTEQTCLMLAAHCGHTETVRYLVSLPEVELNRREGKTALHCAVKANHADVVQLLIDAGADTYAKNYMGHSALHYACQLGALDIVKMLVEAGAGVRAADNQGDTCLILAVYYGHTEAVRYLVGLPEVELNHRADDNSTALQCAVEGNQTDIVQLLIDAGADMDTENTDGRSP